ncbi:MAG: hypothetical protein RIS47_381 [Bacteroidota bacterium]|jgi:tRNA threonylcarbamoyladenosine biosynthesis protein TsaB
MALILNLETSTPVCSVALARDGQTIDLVETSEKMSHASSLAVFIHDILSRNNIEPHQLDAIAVSEGPGSYTGLRIGVSTAKGIAFGTNKPLIAVPTLLSMANGYLQSRKIDPSTWLVPMLDARRMEVYTSLINTNLQVKQATNAKVIDSTSFADTLDQAPHLFFGDGAEKCASTLTHPNAFFDIHYQISARDMGSLAEQAYQQGQFADTAYFEPFYLKEYVAVIAKNKVL